MIKNDRGVYEVGGETALEDFERLVKEIKPGYSQAFTERSIEAVIGDGEKLKLYCSLKGLNYAYYASDTCGRCVQITNLQGGYSEADEQAMEKRKGIADELNGFFSAHPLASLAIAYDRLSGAVRTGETTENVIGHLCTILNLQYKPLLDQTGVSFRQVDPIPAVTQPIYRVLRVLEYTSTDKNALERQVERSIHGVKVFNTSGKGAEITIRAATVGTYPEMIEALSTLTPNTDRVGPADKGGQDNG